MNTTNIWKKEPTYLTFFEVPHIGHVMDVYYKLNRGLNTVL